MWMESKGREDDGDEDKDSERKSKKVSWQEKRKRKKEMKSQHQSFRGYALNHHLIVFVRKAVTEFCRRIRVSSHTALISPPSLLFPLFQTPSS